MVPKLQFAYSSSGRSVRNRRPERELFVIEKRVMTGLGVLALIFAACYVYCISMSVSNVVLREELEVQIAETHSSIGELESEYLEKTYAIDRNYAETLGFSQIESKEFVSHVDAGDALTFKSRN